MELIELKVMGHRCTRCLYEWVPRDVDRPPRICPKCKSAYWDRPRQREQVAIAEVKMA